MTTYIHNAGAVQTVSNQAQVLADLRGATTIPGGVQLDATNSYDGSNTSFEYLIRAGWLLAQNTTSKKFCPVKRTVAVGAGVTTATLVVSNASAFKAGDSLVITGTTGVIASIVYSTNTITLTATKSWSDGAAVYVSGQDAAVAVLGEDVQLYDNKLLVATDATAGTVYREGYLLASALKGDVTACRAVSGNLITKNFTLNTDLV